MKRRGFTLIELLVVIAIIAILAAILFPVFAQAKQAAKKTTELSGTKQLSLGVLIYNGDFDDTFPVSAVYEWNASPEKGWAARIQPYLKSTPILRSPLDSGKDTGDNSFLGPWISFASNSLTAWGTDAGGSNKSIGIITPRFPWEVYEPISGTAAGRPAETVMLAARYNTDCYKAFPTWGDPTGVNRTDFQPWTVIIYDDLLNTPWSAGIAGLIPRGTRAKAPGNGYPGNVYSENDPNMTSGTVSSHYGGIGTFAFADGHAKALKPSQTNPDPQASPDKNMWDSRRQ